MPTTDLLIVVLGGGIRSDGMLPEHVFPRLDKAVELLKKHPLAVIVTSGKYSFLYKNKTPKRTEAKAMQEYLLQKGIRRSQSLVETDSKDSIGNAYYLKKNVFLKRHCKKAIVITSTYHRKRVEYIFRKLFGAGYTFSFIGVSADLSKSEHARVQARQNNLLNVTREMLSHIRDGDHHALSGRLYKTRYYREPRPHWVIDFVAKGK